MKKILFLSGIIVLTACSSNSNDSSTTGETTHAGSNDTIVTTKPVILTGCYQMTMKNDSGWLDIVVNDTTVTGNLKYNLHEKDNNTGTINGVVRDNMIYADYRFQSEGTASVREVIFKISGDTLIQAFGDLIEKNGKIVFVNKNDLQYTNTSPFIKGNCQ
ncbi:MAG TPA: hypothetical protein VNA26_09675 [Chitinophagaceae bacterium]|nr:hypothetical protein [Chitinophagaceae bacterium]